VTEATLRASRLPPAKAISTESQRSGGAPAPLVALLAIALGGCGALDDTLGAIARIYRSATEWLTWLLAVPAVTLVGAIVVLARLERKGG
jgi:hypothetical protein